MPRFLAVAGFLLLFALPERGEAAAEPEQLLAADSLIYLRFDGIDAHRRALEQTALGDLMAGDLGSLFQYLNTVLKDSLGPVLAKGQLLRGNPVEKQRHVREGFDHLAQALGQLGRRGVVLGVEAGEPADFRFQLTLVFPRAGEARQRDALFAVFRLATALAQANVKEHQVEGRTVYQVDHKAPAPVQIAWWQEGDQVVFIVGTAGPTHTMALASGKRPNILTNPLYKSLVGFKKYETAARGFVNFERAYRIARAYHPAVESIVARVGVANLKHLVFHLGFEGRCQRTTAVLHAPGQRQGLLAALAAPRGFDVSQLPPLPPDATAIHANHVDLAAVYDTVVRAIAGSTESANEKTEAAELFKKIDQALGIDVRKGLLSSLGPASVIYNAPAEGPLSLGFGVALQVKDAGKLKESLDALFQSLPAAVGADISIKRQTYHGVELHSVRYAQQGFLFLPSYAIHKGWLVMSLFPQTVQGYLLRSGGKHGTWKPTALTEKVLGELKKEGDRSRVLSLSISDPRPSLQQLCTIGPLIGGLANSFAPNSFDISRLPNSQSITEPLFPNVSVVLDDGDFLRLEGHASLAVPLLNLAGMDTYFATVFGFQLFRFGF